MKAQSTKAIVGVWLVAVSASIADQVQTNAPSPSYPVNLSVDVGPFSGLGVAIAWRPVEQFGLRGGIHYADIDFPSYDFDDGETTGTFDADVLYQSAHLTLDFYPFKRRSFRISAGVLVNHNEFAFETPAIVIDGTSYAGEQLLADVKWDDVTPYVAIGGDLFHFDESKRWSMGAELGVAFGAPTTTVSNPTGGISQGDLDSFEEDFSDVFDEIKIWPIVKVSVNFKF